MVFTIREQESDPGFWSNHWIARMIVVDDVRDAIDSGMDAHIAKPVQIDTLKATIQQVLDGREARLRGE